MNYKDMFDIGKTRNDHRVTHIASGACWDTQHDSISESTENFVLHSPTGIASDRGLGLWLVLFDK